jgi:succinate dehydrogenase hydrophobic anchor subunit
MRGLLWVLSSIVVGGGMGLGYAHWYLTGFDQSLSQSLSGLFGSIHAVFMFAGIVVGTVLCGMAIGVWATIAELRRPGSVQFSLSTMMLIVAGVAIVLGLWRILQPDLSFVAAFVPVGIVLLIIAGPMLGLLAIRLGRFYRVWFLKQDRPRLPEMKPSSRAADESRT